MPDEVKPDATRPAFRLRAALVVPAGWPPDVAPNQIITASHINAIRSSVYAWPGNVDGQLHTLSNVHLVNATGVLADPTLAAGDLIARDAAAIGRLPVGGAGQVLTVDTALPMKLKWATPALAPVLSFNTRTGAVMPQAGDYTAAMVAAIPATLLTTKGDLIAFSTATGRMPAGIDGQILRADAAATFGLRWAGESVPSVFTRTGPIVAQAGDYAASQVTNAVSTIATYPDPAWITSLSWAKLIGVPASFTPAAHTHDAAAIVSGVLSTARLGTGVANNTVYLRGDGTWAAAGTGGGGGVISVFGRAGDVIAQSGDYTAAMVGAIPANLLTSTGDLLVRNNINQITRLPIGANGQVLQTDLATSVGMKWTSISASVQTPWVTNIDGSNFDLVNVHRLGVALAVPNYPVDVVGDINYTGVLRSNGVPVVFGGSQTPWTQNINASGFSLNNAGTIGVGVAAPQAAPIMVATHTPGIAGSLAVQDLDATTSGNPVLLVTGLGSEGTRSWAVGNRGGATFLKDLYVWNDRSSALLFGTNSAERMRITAAGLVGIGRTPATYPLEVQGDVSVTGVYRINGVPIATSQTPWTQDIDGAGFKLSNVASVLVASASPFIRFVETTASNVLEMSINSAGLMQWKKWDGTTQFVLNTVNGNIGIGTTGPNTQLSVIPAVTPSTLAAATQVTIGEASNNSNYRLALGYYSDAPNYKAVIQATNGTPAAGFLLLNPLGGNVGIGTTGPNVDFHLFRSGIYAQMKVESNVSGDSGYIIKDSAREWKLGINLGGAGAGQFQLFNSTNATTIISGTDNRVGILRGNPNYTLDVNGDVNCVGVFRVGGAPIAHITNVSVGGGALNTVFQNTTGKPMFVTVTATIQGGSYMHFRTDAGNPPASTVSAYTNPMPSGTTIGGSVSGWVMPGHFYRAFTPDAVLTTWAQWY